MKFRIVYGCMIFALLYALFYPVIGGSATRINPVSLTYSAAERTQLLSFFLFVILLSTFLIRVCWNRLAKEFPALSPLKFGSALAVSLLWGLLSIVVLVMISGARELLTPGAWEKTGLVYQLVTQNNKLKPVSYSEQELLEQNTEKKRLLRQNSLARVQVMLLNFAQRHDGQFPTQEEASQFSEEAWRLPGEVGGSYLYFPGRRWGETGRIVVIEPEVAEKQFVLFSDGIISEVLPEQIRLMKEKTSEK